MKINDTVILANLRENSRETLTKISRRTRIPVSTLFERIKSYNGGIVKRFTSIIDFSKLGYTTKAHILVKPLPETKTAVQEFLMKNRAVNSLYKVSTNFEYLAEVICKDMQELHQFLSRLEALRLEKKEVLFVIEDLKEEDFMTQTGYGAPTIAA